MTVVLAAKANGEKMKPYMVFPGNKREAEKLKKDTDIKHRCFVESTTKEVEQVLKTFSFGNRRLLAWDSYHTYQIVTIDDSMVDKS